MRESDIKADLMQCHTLVARTRSIILVGRIGAGVSLSGTTHDRQAGFQSQPHSLLSSFKMISNVHYATRFGILCNSLTRLRIQIFRLHLIRGYQHTSAFVEVIVLKREKILMQTKNLFNIHLSN